MGTPWVSFDGKDCSGCKHLNERGYCEFTGCIIPCTVRATIPEEKPLTNADRIRSMTDEDLAIEMTAKGGCPHDCEEPENMDTDCVKCWLDWLRRQEENEDEKSKT